MPRRSDEVFSGVELVRGSQFYSEKIFSSTGCMGQTWTGTTLEVSFVGVMHKEGTKIFDAMYFAKSAVAGFFLGLIDLPGHSPKGL